MKTALITLSIVVVTVGASLVCNALLDDGKAADERFWEVLVGTAFAIIAAIYWGFMLLEDRRE